MLRSGCESCAGLVLVGPRAESSLAGREHLAISRAATAAGTTLVLVDVHRRPHGNHGVQLLHILVEHADAAMTH